ncbi:MAG: fumarylacetoacetase [Acidobacteriota bacterium]
MSYTVDHTHDPDRRSWIESAHGAGDFPLQNLPLGVFSTSNQEKRLGVAIGDEILDLTAVAATGLLKAELAMACRGTDLNGLMALPAKSRRALRHRLFELLVDDADESFRGAVGPLLLPSRDAELHLPAEVGDYTDFYASVFHATNVGKLFRPDNPLLPNYKHIPIGYHGRSSSLVASGQAIHRPHGQSKAPDATEPSFGPSRLLDYELEVGIFVGPGNDLGTIIDLADAHQHFFGLCLLNDWSARDIQGWEYQPLGPFLGKSFASSLSPWVVTAEALAPYRGPVFERPGGDPRPLPYLFSDREQAHGGIDLTVEAWLQTAQMAAEGHEPVRLSAASFRDLYWTTGQMITHHASNGCNLRPGDLLGSGTVSGASAESRGCLLEITQRGKHPVELPSGEERRFLQDGDEVILRGFCEAPDRVRIGFGECRGKIVG